MVIGIFTDDLYPYIGGIGRHSLEIANRLTQEQGFVFSPCENRIINHAKVKAPFYTMLKNLGLSLWLHQNLNRLIIKTSLPQYRSIVSLDGYFSSRSRAFP